MELRQLRVDNLRVIESLTLDLSTRWNLFLGANGSGKTTVLESAYLLSHGRSFRTSARDVLIRHGCAGYSVFGELSQGSSSKRVGVSRERQRFEARLNGEVVTAGSLLRHTAVVCFEPGSHALISGGSEERRRFIDWGVFHVEHEFLTCWRRYQRALKQRNALLRGRVSTTDLDLWDHELVQAALPLTTMRSQYFVAWSALAVDLLRELVGELGAPEFSFHPGFDARRSLEEALAARRALDVARGHTSAGPHRADWSVSFGPDTRREHLSRGQEKLVAFACVMAQARCFADGMGTWPILCLDDIASEIDTEHRQRVLRLIDASGAQVLVTATQEPPAFAELGTSIARFHVEQGRVAPLL